MDVWTYFKEPGLLHDLVKESRLTSQIKPTSPSNGRLNGKIHTIEPSSIVDPSSMTIIDDVAPTFIGDRDEIYTTEPSSIIDPSSTTIIDDVVPTSTEDRVEAQIHTASSPHSSVDATFIMLVDDMPQTPRMKKVVKRVVKRVNMKDVPAKKRKRDNEDAEGYTGLRPKDIL